MNPWQAIAEQRPFIRSCARKWARGNDLLAEEWAAEAERRVVANWSRYDQRRALAAWVSVIVRNVALDDLKRSGGRACDLTQARGLIDQSDKPHESALVGEIKGAVRMALTELARKRPKQARALIMVDLHRLEYDQAARMNGWTPGTLRSRLIRGRKAMRLALSKWN